ncbi:hypothetical protein B0J13DRAFT_603209 [Dactylonectria estremocensis]|uniref:Uncharacterized protein n=1 Tax=Dactylonectria estremocensis TaxID=1079267 RepID=A0A9P9FCS6_9HYPO|nr:hypothetical protein B0J13DRAFT_603209 [Dactylonectria estremocensis]
MFKRKQNPSEMTEYAVDQALKMNAGLVTVDLTGAHSHPAEGKSIFKRPIALLKKPIKTEPQREGFVVGNKLEDPEEVGDVPSFSDPPIIQSNNIIKRKEVMEQGVELLDKLGSRQHNRRDLSEDMNAWLDEHKVRVLTQHAKGLVYLWGMKYDRKFTFWVHRAYKDLAEYSYTDDEEATQPLLSWRDMIKEPLREMRSIAAESDRDTQRRIIHVTKQLQKGMAWLDWQEQRRHAQRETAAEEEKRAREELSAATTRLRISQEALNVSGGKLDELLRKTNEVLAIAKSTAGPAVKKRRVESMPASASSKRKQIVEDAQVLADTLKYSLPSARTVFVQLEKVLKHFDGDVAKDIDYDFDRCLIRRRKRISELLDSHMMNDEERTK